jgi:hypothetical protein
MPGENGVSPFPGLMIVLSSGQVKGVMGDMDEYFLSIRYMDNRL